MRIGDFLLSLLISGAVVALGVISLYLTIKGGYLS